jgi:uncharacterized protein (TIGR02246 family)
MPTDEQLIRDLIDDWLRATAAGELPQLLSLMDEDVVFLVAGQPPMRGKDAFASGFQKALEHSRIEATSDIQEIKVFGDWAYCWNNLSVIMTSRDDGARKRRGGYTLTILRKKTDGKWVVTRDANLLAEEPDSRR